MTRIDFYILKQQTEPALIPFVCRLLDKAYQQGHKIYVCCETPQIAQQLDERLWTFSDTSFVPHALVLENDAHSAAPVLIGVKQVPTAAHDILLNLNKDPVGTFQQFQRVIEVIVEQEPWLQQGRIKYKSYKEQGCIPKTHEIQNPQNN